MDTIIYPDKGEGEVISLTMTFSDRLLAGEVVNGATVAVSVYAGTDATPSNMLSGAVSYDATSVTQKITGGVVGVVYNIVFVATGSDSHSYGKVARLAVVSDSNVFA